MSVNRRNTCADQYQKPEQCRSRSLLVNQLVRDWLFIISKVKRNILTDKVQAYFFFFFFFFYLKKEILLFQWWRLSDHGTTVGRIALVLNGWKCVWSPFNASRDRNSWWTSVTPGAPHIIARINRIFANERLPQRDEHRTDRWLEKRTLERHRAVAGRLRGEWLSREIVT